MWSKTAPVTALAIAATAALLLTAAPAQAITLQRASALEQTFSVVYTFTPSTQRDLTYTVTPAPLNASCVISQSHTASETTHVPRGNPLDSEDRIQRAFTYSFVANRSGTGCGSLNSYSLQEWRNTISNGNRTEILDTKLESPVTGSTNDLFWNQFVPGDDYSPNPILFVTRKRNGLAVKVSDTSSCFPDRDPLDPPPGPLPCPNPPLNSSRQLFGSS